MLPIALSIAGAFTTFLIARIASGSTGSKGAGAPSMAPASRPAVTLPPKQPVVVSPPPARAAAPEPPPAVIEVAPPPPEPPPPVDDSPALPTPPPAPVAVAPPPPVVRAPAPVIAPPPAATPAPAPTPGVRAPEPPPAVIEVAPPPPPPPPPVDTSPALPTPPAPLPVTSATNAPTAGPAAELSVPSSPPPGFDAVAAAALAPAMAAQLRSKQYDYSRPQLKSFQTAAGLTADGIYGNDTWGALLYFTTDAPRALFKPTAPTPYPWAALIRATPPAPPPATAPMAPAPAPAPAPRVELGPVPAAAPAPAQPAPAAGPQPPAGFDPDKARKLAKQVTANIDSKQRNYSNALLRDFQKAAGIAADGLYGGGARGALIAFGIARPPQPLFKPTTTQPYPWQAQIRATS